MNISTRRARGRGRWVGENIVNEGVVTGRGLKGSPTSNPPKPLLLNLLDFPTTGYSPLEAGLHDIGTFYSSPHAHYMHVNQ